MRKEDPRDEIDVGAPSAGFGVAAEVLDHEKDARFLICWCSMELTMIVVMLDSMVELTVVDLELLLTSQTVRAHLGSWDL
mmetsp:Transcript_41008/g.75065  ORF Transcript_41008/g.75065 Transcript_41008/m.75065 type:complete len:80 (-) Transcript_41008:740-979(-)